MCEKRATLRCDVVTLWMTSQHFQVKDSKNSKDSALKNIKASGWQAMELLDHKPNCSKNQTSPKRCHHSAASRHCEELCTTFPDALQVWCQALPNSQAVLAETSWTRIGLRFILKGHNLYCTYKYKYIYIPVYICISCVYLRISPQPYQLFCIYAAKGVTAKNATSFAKICLLLQRFLLPCRPDVSNKIWTNLVSIWSSDNLFSSLLVGVFLCQPKIQKQSRKKLYKTTV